MKKTLMVLAVAAAAMTVSAVDKLDPKTCTEAQVHAALAESLAASNNWWRCGASNNLWIVLCKPNFHSIRAEADEALSEKGLTANRWWGFVSTYPKMSELARKRVGADAAYPKSIAIAKRLNTNIDICNFFIAGGSFDDVAVLLSEIVAFPETCAYNVKALEVGKKYMQKYAVKAVKKYIRSQGKSFVTKDGVNPCETYMTGLTEALNAPRFNGLDAWYKSIGLAGVDLSALPSAADVVKLKQEVLDGEKEMTERNKAILYVCLGVDGYNAFVREYNGD